MPRVLVTSPTTVEPNPVPLKRDDQSIMWELGENLEWGEDPPIVFLGPGGESPVGLAYSAWPTGGTNPSAIDNGAPLNRRPYFASANDPLPNGVDRMYHYEMNVVMIHEDGSRTSHRVQVQWADLSWHDPDVVNEPKP
jgi:hypothetical protein